jgi:hypothetical protein
MEVIQTGIKDLVEIHPKIFGDGRGWFLETSLILIKAFYVAYIFKNLLLPRQSWYSLSKEEYLILQWI